MKNDFNDFRFRDLNYKSASNKYFTMNRVSKNEDRIVVKVADEHLINTKYGYALILDRTHVIFLKEWAVSRNFYGNEVLITKDFFNVKEFGEFDDFFENENDLTFDSWLQVAKEQQANDENPVRWEK